MQKLSAVSIKARSNIDSAQTQMFAEKLWEVCCRRGTWQRKVEKMRRSSISGVDLSKWKRKKTNSLLRGCEQLGAAVEEGIGVCAHKIGIQYRPIKKRGGAIWLSASRGDRFPFRIRRRVWWCKRTKPKWIPRVCVDYWRAHRCWVEVIKWLMPGETNKKDFHLAQPNKVPGCRLVKAAAQVKGAKSLERYQKKTRAPFILDKVVKQRGLIKILPHAEGPHAGEDGASWKVK